MAKNKVIVISDIIKYIQGGAATSRIKNIARIYKLLGFDIEIISIYSDECFKKPLQIEKYITFFTFSILSNKNGIKKLLRFIYLYLRLGRYLLKDKNITYHLYSCSYKMIIFLKLISFITKSKIIIELVEWQPSINQVDGRTTGFGTFLNRVTLKFGDGIIVISDFLKYKVMNITEKYEKKNTIIKLPILFNPIDLNNIPSIDPNFKYPYLFWAADLNYNKTINFLINVFIELKKINLNSDLKLLISGFNKTKRWDSEELLLKKSGIIRNDIIFMGMLDYNDLINFFRYATALLVPLHEDERSKARFPSKIAEYLSSGRPIVTTNIGEIKNYFIDGVNAFIAEKDDPLVFAKKILQILEFKEISDSVGNNGKSLANKEFTLDINKYKLELLLKNLNICLEN